MQKTWRKITRYYEQDDKVKRVRGWTWSRRLNASNSQFFVIHFRRVGLICACWMKWTLIALDKWFFNGKINNSVWLHLLVIFFVMIKLLNNLRHFLTFFTSGQYSIIEKNTCKILIKLLKFVVCRKFFVLKYFQIFFVFL